MIYLEIEPALKIFFFLNACVKSAKPQLHPVPLKTTLKSNG